MPSRLDPKRPSGPPLDLPGVLTFLFLAAVASPHAHHIDGHHSWPQWAKGGMEMRPNNRRGTESLRVLLAKRRSSPWDFCTDGVAFVAPTTEIHPASQSGSVAQSEGYRIPKYTHPPKNGKDQRVLKCMDSCVLKHHQVKTSGVKCPCPESGRDKPPRTSRSPAKVLSWGETD